jgi:hypothetical protein
MLSKLSNDIECEICGGGIDFDNELTITDYAIAITANVLDIDEKVDDIINKHLVYRCRSCGHVFKYTYKDIERVMRRKLTEKTLLLIVHDRVKSNTKISMEKFFIYCGKCQGIDGTGCCTKSIFEKCEIKRFPINVF